MNDYKKALIWLTKASIFIIPFVPLYISQSLFFPYITGKAFVFRTLVEIAFAAWAWLAIMYKEYRPKKSALFYALIIWLVVASLATVFSVNPERSLWSNFERMEGLFAYAHLFAYFLILSSVFRKSDWNIFFNLFLVSGIVENFYVLLQKLGYLASPQGGFRTDGTIGNPTYLAAYLIFLLAIAALLWLREVKSSPASYFYAFMMAWTMLSIFFTASRGPVLGLLVGLILASLAYLILKNPEKESDRNIYRLIGMGLVALVAIPVILWLMRDMQLIKGNAVLSRLTSLSFSERTVTSRFSIWAMSFEGVKEHPVLGWGPENYAVVFSKYFRPELWRQEPWFDRSHNIIFDWLINAGFLGLISYLGIFVAAFYMLLENFRKRKRLLEEGLLIGALFIAYFFQNLFVFDNIATYISFFAFLAFINSESADLEPFISGEKNQVRKDDSGFAEVYAGLIFVALIGTAYFVNWRPLMVNLNLLNALKSQAQNQAEMALDYYKKALAYDPIGKQEIREQMTRYAVSVGSSNLPVEFKDKVLRFAIEQAQEGVEENPLDPRAYLFLGGLYSRVGFSDQALAVLKKASDLSPRKQQIYFEIADIYLQTGNYKSAVAELEKSFNLDQEYDQARLNLVAAYILSGDQKKADELLVEKYGTMDVAEMILVQVYSRTNNYQRLIGTWEAFVENQPTAENYKSLAGAHLLAGDRSGAIEALEAGIEKNPQFRSEASVLLNQIRSGQ